MTVYQFVFSILRSKVEEILPTKQKKYLPTIEDSQNSFVPFCDVIFVIDKYIQSRIIPKPFEIIYASNFSTERITEECKSNLNRLIKYLEKGKEINSTSHGFLPKSTNEYFTDENSSKRRRYNVDFSNQFFGIRHFHLDNHNKSEDCLLYYVLDQERIYFLTIGRHKEMYSQSNVEILVNEFLNLILSLVYFFTRRHVRKKGNPQSL